MAAFDNGNDPQKVIADERGTAYGTQPGIPRGRAAWFGGKTVQIGPRICPIVAPITNSATGSESDVSNADEILLKQKASEEGAAIQYRTCSWQKVRSSFLDRPPRCWLAQTAARRRVVACANSQISRLPHSYFPNTFAWYACTQSLAALIHHQCASHIRGAPQAMVTRLSPRAETNVS